MAALLPLLVSPCVTSVPHAYSYSPHVSWFCAGRGVHVHLLHGGHILERRCVESVPAALPPFPPALLSMCLTCTHTRADACAEGASGILLHACAYA